MDEIFIGGERSGKRGRGAAGKTLVLIAAQATSKGNGRIRLARVASASGDNLCSAVTQAVDIASIICTDGWKGYNRLKDLGYTHEIIRPTPALGDNLLPLANRVASLLKRWLLGTHQGAVSLSDGRSRSSGRAGIRVCRPPESAEGRVRGPTQSHIV